jgi:hypothetical protein
LDENLIRRLVSTIKCSVCGEGYEGANVRVLGQDDDVWFVSAYCPTCGSHSLVAAVINEGPLPELITDLTEDEFDRFSEADEITTDDVLDIHALLKEFDGDFIALLSRD